VHLNANRLLQFTDLSIRSKPVTTSQHSPSSSDSSFQVSTSYPFPTLWTASEGTKELVKVLPAYNDIFLYLQSLPCRAVPLAFPYVPERCSTTEVERFLSNLEHNALVHPEELGLLFASLALGLQHGIYDRYGEKWLKGATENETKRGDVFGEFPPFNFHVSGR
jgi:hypothetical protein